MELDGNRAELRIPAFDIPAELKMPGNANACELRIALGQYALYQSRQVTVKYKVLEIEKDQKHMEEQFISFDVHPGCLCVIAISIDYYQQNDRYRTRLNNKALNPAMIVGAMMTEGEFAEPTSPVREERWDCMSPFKVKEAASPLM